MNNLNDWLQQYMQQKQMEQMQQPGQMQQMPQIPQPMGQVGQPMAMPQMPPMQLAGNAQVDQVRQWLVDKAQNKYNSRDAQGTLRPRADATTYPSGYVAPQAPPQGVLAQPLPAGLVDEIARRNKFLRDQ